MADWTKTNRFLGQFLPAIMEKEMGLDYERKRAQAWLQKTLEEYAAYGEQQQKIQQSGLIGDLIRNMANPEFFKGRTFGERQLGDWIGQIVPEEMRGQMTLPAPGESEDAIASAEKAMKNIMLSVMAGEYPNEQDLEPAIRAFGFEAVKESIAQVSKQIADDLDRDVRSREIGVQEALVPVREKEVGVREAELAFERTGKPGKPDQEKKIEALQKEIDSLSIRYFKIGVRPEETKTIKNQIIDKVGQVKKMKAELGIEPDENYAKLAETLKAQGFKREDLISNQPLIKGLTDNGYSNWRLLELF